MMADPSEEHGTTEAAGSSWGHCAAYVAFDTTDATREIIEISFFLT